MKSSTPNNFEPNQVSFCQHLSALLVRNYLIKRRQWSKTLLEMLFPFVMIMVIKGFDPIKVLDPVERPVIDVSLKDDRPLYLIENLISIANSTWYIINKDSVLSQTEFRQLTDNIEKTHNDFLEFPKVYMIETIINNTFTDMNRFEKFYLLNYEDIQLAIVLEGRTRHSFNYSIRLKAKNLPEKSLGSQSDCQMSTLAGNRCSPFLYYQGGFTTIQAIVDTSIINLLEQSNTTFSLPDFQIGIFPQPKIVDTSNNGVSLLPFVLSLAFVPYLSIVPVLLVTEKEKKIKVAMFMMGLDRPAYWISWMIVEGSVSMVSCVGITIMICIFKVMLINPFLLYFLFQLYVFSFILIGFMISPFFSSSKTVSAVGPFLGMLIPFFFFGINFVDLSMSVKYTLSLFSPFAFIFTMKSLVNSVDYITFSNSLVTLDFPVGVAIIFIVFDSFIYIGLTTLFDYLISNDINVFRLIFGFKKSDKNRSMKNPIISDVESMPQSFKDQNVFEVRHVGKNFESKVAVNSVSLNIYESQITAILGQNGAGKTTLISMMIGELKPTSGEIIIYDLNVKNPSDLRKLRTGFGVCLQQDILFDELTPIEHLEFFGRIKGLMNDNLNDEVEFLMTQLELTDLKNSISKNLSGGEKRKLCIAIALIGGSRVIFLDEPTSGIDAYSRRLVWSLLESFKKDRIIILTTHFMDEADVLSDRKAILANGKIRCVGSSLFLKNKFGIGYHLRVDTEKSKIDSVKELVFHKIISAKLERVTNSEMIFNLPLSQTKNFSDLFDSIDAVIADKNSGIKGYGISLSTLEDVFLKICHETDLDKKVVELDTTENSTEKCLNIPNLEQVVYKTNTWNIVWEFSKIRLLLLKRNWTFALSLCLNLIIYFVIFSVINNVANKEKLITLKSSLYHNRNVLIQNLTYNSLEQEIKCINSSLESVLLRDLTLSTMESSIYAVQFVQEDNSEKDSNMAIIFNKPYYHSLPILQNAITNMLASIWSGSSIEITTINHPLPLSGIEKYYSQTIDLVFIFLIMILMCSIPPMIAVEVVEDRSEKIKSYLHSCGMSDLLYWYTTWLNHCIIFLCPMIAIFIFTLASKISFIVVCSDSIFCTIILFLLFIPASIGVCYILSHFFNEKDTALSFIVQICIAISIVLNVISMFISSKDPKKALTINWIFSLIWPFYSPYAGLYSMWMINILNSASEKKVSYYSWDKGITPCFLALIIQICLFVVLIPAIDRAKQKGIKLTFSFQTDNLSTVTEETIAEVDSDVLEERCCVNNIYENLPSNAPLLLLKDLTKVYDGEKLAVNNVSLIIESGQIFGLLGPNGAGKTSVIKIIDGEEQQTTGMVLFQGKTLDSKFKYKMVSYCPQHNPFWMNLTLMEQLKLFAIIRGVNPDEVYNLCLSFLKLMNIEEHKDKNFDSLSGGTKRKLCMLVAILGNTKLTLLDEPSSGMDPNSKRLMWDIIITAFEPKGKKSAILTTHSMDEAEALSTKLAIMTNGTIKCLGTIQHLNNKYGLGYILEIKWNENSTSLNVEVIENLILKLFPNMTIRETQNNRIKANVPQTDVKSLGSIFSTLEEWKTTYEDIQEYGFCQSSIEQVFIEFAKKQAENIQQEVQRQLTSVSHP